MWQCPLPVIYCKILLNGLKHALLSTQTMKIFIPRLSIASMVVVLMTSCENDELEGTQSDHYSIKSEVVDGRTTSVYKYNQQGKIAEIEALYYYNKYFYDSEGRLSRLETAFDPATLSSGVYVDRTALMTSKNSVINRHQLFIYTADGKLAEIENYAEKDGDFVYTSMNSFAYEGEHIARVNLHDEQEQITQFRTYEYDDRGNVKKEAYYTHQMHVDPVLISEFVFEYDEKKNPFSILSALGNPGLYTNTNNITEVVSVLSEDVPGTESQMRYTTEYIYNPYNFPVKVLSENSDIEYRY